MNHDSIAAEDVIARYVAGRLSPDEEREFDAHLVDCAECSEQVEQELGLRNGLLATAADRKITSPAAPLWSSSRSMRWILPAAALLLVVAGGLAVSLWRTAAALTTAREASQAEQRRADEAVRAAQELERRVAGLEGQPRQAIVPTPVVATLLPTTVFALTTVRSGEADAASVNRFSLDRGETSGQVVLSIDVPPGNYALTLKDSGGRDVWSGGRFTPSSQDVLSVSVERRFLTDGRYTLEVHRPESGGRTTLVARYPFEVITR